MTTYTSIANSAVDSGSPIDEALVTALRDNPLAIQEGDATAPRIQQAALADEIRPRIFIEEQAITGGACSFITGITSDYSLYEIVFEDLYASASCGLYWRTGRSGSFNSGTSHYKWRRAAINSSTVTATESTGDTEVQMTGSSFVDSSSANRTAGVIRIYAPMDATKTRMDFTIIGGSSGVGRQDGAGLRDDANDHDRFQIFPSTGTFSGGTARLYGYR